MEKTHAPFSLLNAIPLFTDLMNLTLLDSSSQKRFTLTKKLTFWEEGEHVYRRNFKIEKLSDLRGRKE